VTIDDGLYLLRPIRLRTANDALPSRQATRRTPWRRVTDGDTQLGIGMTRSIDRGYAERHGMPPVLADDIRAGLANGSMVRGTTTRTATGRAMTPVQGDILLPHQVSSVTPALRRDQTAVAWEVIGRPDVDEGGQGLAGAGGGTRSGDGGCDDRLRGVALLSSGP